MKFRALIKNKKGMCILLSKCMEYTFTFITHIANTRACEEMCVVCRLSVLVNMVKAQSP